MWLPRHKRQASERQNRDRGKASRNDVGGSGNGRTAAAAAASFIYIYIYPAKKRVRRKARESIRVLQQCRIAAAQRGSKDKRGYQGGNEKI